MKEIQITMFETDDGRYFDCASKAKRHEDFINSKDKLREIVKSYNEDNDSSLGVDLVTELMINKKDDILDLLISLEDVPSEVKIEKSRIEELKVEETNVKQNSLESAADFVNKFK